MFRDCYLGSNDRCNNEVTIKHEAILIKQGFLHFACRRVSRKACMHSISFSISLQDLFVIHLSLSEGFSQEKANKLNYVHISKQITLPSSTPKAKHTEVFNTALSRAGGCVKMCV